MKFCKYCGKQLDDNAVCDCQASQQNAQKEQVQQVTFTAPQQQPQQQTMFTAPQPQAQQQPQASPYAVNPNATPAGEGKFVKALKNIPVVFTSYWKNPKQTIDVAKKENDLVIAGLFSAIFFIGVLIATCCLYGSMHLIVFNFVKVFVASLLLAVFTAVFYVFAKFFSVKIFVKQAETKKAFFDAFIEFAVHSVPVTALLLVGGLTAFISFYVGMFFFLFAIVYLVTTLLTEIKSDVPEVKNNFVFVLLVSTFITVGVGIVLLVMTNMISWWNSGLIQSAGNLLGGFLKNFAR